MKDRKRHFLKDAVVLMIVSAMVLSAIPAVTAVDTENYIGDDIPFKSQVPSGTNKIYDTCRPLPKQTPDMSGGFGADGWIQYCDDTVENSIGLTSGGEACWAIELSDIELAAFRDYDICEIVFIWFRWFSLCKLI
jgi:hypothetical protein